MFVFYLGKITTEDSLTPTPFPTGSEGSRHTVRVGHWSRHRLRDHEYRGHRHESQDIIVASMMSVERFDPG